MSICTIDGCNDIVEARGLCRKHYKRWWKYGDPNTILFEQLGMKMQQAQKVPKSKVKTKDVLKALKRLENIATSGAPLQQKVDQMNLELLRLVKNESH